MRRVEALIALSVSYLFITAGVVWQFGAYGLMGSGVVAIAAVSFADIGKGGSDDA